MGFVGQSLGFVFVPLAALLGADLRDDSITLAHPIAVSLVAMGIFVLAALLLLRRTRMLYALERLSRPARKELAGAAMTICLALLAIGGASAVLTTPGGPGQQVALSIGSSNGLTLGVFKAQNNSNENQALVLKYKFEANAVDMDLRVVDPDGEAVWSRRHRGTDISYDSQPGGQTTKLSSTRKAPIPLQHRVGRPSAITKGVNGVLIEVICVG